MMSAETSSKGKHTRQEILRSAYQLFLKNGFHGTSMRQIARGAGIAVGGIYNHFASKDEIFMALLFDRHPIFDILPALNAAEGQDIESFVRDAATKVVEVVQNRPDFLNLMFIELVEFNAQHIPDLFQNFFPQALTFVQHFFDRRQGLRPVPIPVLLRAFLGLFFSYVMTEILMGDRMPADMEKSTLDHFVDIFLHGILAEGNQT
jgi:TetR/AcrR family transcriptional repressor of mexJK operon